MKNYKYKFLGFFLIAALVFTACEQDDSVNFTEPDPALQLDTPTSNNVMLNFGFPDNPALTVTWTDEVTGSSSYDVQLAVEEDFDNPTTVGTSNTNSFSITTGELNSALNMMNLDSYNNVPIYMRVSANSVVSNVVMFSVTAFATDGVEITSPSEAEDFVLSLSTIDETAITVNWEDAGNLSTEHNVQLALSGTDFANPVSLGIVTDENSLEATHGELNAVALGLGMATDVSGNVDVRVTSTSVNTTGATLERISETVSISITPYSVSFPFLYFVGDATTPGWDNNNNNTPIFRNQDVPNNYVYTGYFNAGAFKLLETLGQWQPQWGTNDGSTLAVNPGGGSDPGTFNVSAAGYYSYSFTTVGEGGTFTVEAYDASSAPTYGSIAIIGDATPNGWDGDNDTNLNQDPNNPHLWYLNDVILTGGGQILIRADDQWNNVWRYTGSEEDFYGNSILAGGGDNIPFNGDTGSYDVWFNDLDGSYVFIPN